MQAKASTPYVVLSGNIKPGQSSDAASGYATAEGKESLNSMLGGGHTPLIGNRKVEAMLGIKIDPSSHASMPPPAARPSRA
jgi:U4/U6.U5 tri-snRNP-associated protein 1